MKRSKNFLLIVILTAGILTALAVFFSINRMPVDKIGVLTRLSKISAGDSFRVRPLTNITYEVSAKRLKQGKYLTTAILGCFTCHSSRNWEVAGAPPRDQNLGGGDVIWEDSSMRFIAPNISPDKETGAGTWSDDMFARAIREGVGHDGRALSPIMPYMSFKNLSDEDLASVIVYVRSLKPFHNILLPTKIAAEERPWIQKMLKPVTRPVLPPDFSDPKVRGRYLVHLAGCSDCHTSHSDYTPGAFAGGNLIEHIDRKAFTVNITPDPSGVTYGPDAFIFTLRTGKGGTLNPIMPWIVFKNMTDDDLKAIYTYLRTIPASRHYISNQHPFTHCAICGQEHGLGDKNKLEKPAGIKIDPDVYDHYAGTYLNEEYNSTRLITREGNKLIGKAWENAPEVQLIPQSELHFLAPGWVLPISFIKDKNGRVAQLVEDSDEGMIYKKIK